MRADTTSDCADTAEHAATGHLVLDGDPEAASHARVWVCASLAADLPALADDIALVASELVTNCLRHSRSFGMPRSVEVEIDRRPTIVILTVIDQGTAIRPNPLPGLDHAPVETDVLPKVKESGQGLPIIRALADDCGHTETAWPKQERKSWALWRIPS